MTVEIAIELLQHYLGRDSRCYDPDLYDAIKLGIDALNEKLEREKGELK